MVLILAFCNFFTFSGAGYLVAKKRGEMLSDLTFRHQNL